MVSCSSTLGRDGFHDILGGNSWDKVAELGELLYEAIRVVGVDATSPHDP